MFSKKKKKQSDEAGNKPVSSVVVGGSVHRLNKKTAGLILLLLVICLLVFAGYWVFLKPSPKTAPSTDLSELLQADDSDNSQANLVQKYGVESDKATQEARNSDSTKWDKSTLDKAYVSLLYADKVGAFSQVYTMLSLIESADRSGLNVDDNSYGITQSMRDAIRQRADASAQKVMGSQTGDNGE